MIKLENVTLTFEEATSKKGGKYHRATITNPETNKTAIAILGEYDCIKAYRYLTGNTAQDYYVEITEE